MDALTQRELAELRDRLARARVAREKARAEADEPVQRPRYATDEERRAAKVRTWRKSKRRGTCTRCGGQATSKTCRACYLKDLRANAKTQPCPQCGGAKPDPRAATCRTCYAASIVPAHGTMARYTSRNLRCRCRCGLCRAAASAYHRAWRARLVEWKAAA